MMNEYKDLDIKKVQNLFKDGFKLISIIYEGQKEATNKETINVTLIFARGNEEKTIEIKNSSPEFSDYVTKLHFARGTNFRKELVYRDSNDYWRNAKPPSRWAGSKICISGYEFTNIEIYPFTRALNRPNRFVFEILLNSDESKNFLKIDFRNLLQFFKDDQILFAGYITAVESSSTNSFFRVFCQDFPAELTSQTLSVKTRIKKGNHSDFIALICDITELHYTPTSIDNLHPENRTFNVIIPIYGVKITDNLQMGACLITPYPPETPFLKNEKFIQQETSYAHISLKRSKFYDVVTDSMKFIQGMINLLNYRIKLPTFLEGYHFTDQKSILKLGNIIYFEDSKYNSEIMLFLPLLNAPKFEKDILIQRYFRPIQPLSEKLIAPDRELIPDEEKEFWIFYYLNAAEEKVDINRIAAFLDLWIALDFLCARFNRRQQDRFIQKELDEIKTYFRGFSKAKESELATMREIAPDEFSARKERYKIMQQKMVQLIDKFNELSITEQLKNLFAIYHFDLSREEWKNYRNAREKRNKIIHGGQIQKVSRAEYNIISKIIYFTLKNALIDKSL